MGDTREEHLAAITAVVAANGFAVQPCTTGVLHTVGLHQTTEPELVTFGAEDSDILWVLSAVADAFRRGERREANRVPFGVRAGGNTVVVALSPVTEALADVWAPNIAGWHRFVTAGSPPAYEVMQLVWRDPNGRFPWETRYHPDFTQPLLDGSADVRPPE